MFIRPLQHNCMRAFSALFSSHFRLNFLIFLWFRQWVVFFFFPTTVPSNFVFIFFFALYCCSYLSSCHPIHSSLIVFFIFGFVFTQQLYCEIIKTQNINDKTKCNRAKHSRFTQNYEWRKNIRKKKLHEINRNLRAFEAACVTRQIKRTMKWAQQQIKYGMDIFSE